MVVELRLQYSRQIFSDLFETYKTFERSIITDFDDKVYVQNYQSGRIRFENRFFKNY